MECIDETPTLSAACRRCSAGTVQVHTTQSEPNWIVLREWGVAAQRARAVVDKGAQPGGLGEAHREHHPLKGGEEARGRVVDHDAEHGGLAAPRDLLAHGGGVERAQHEVAVAERAARGRRASGDRPQFLWAWPSKWAPPTARSTRFASRARAGPCDGLAQARRRRGRAWLTSAGVPACVRPGDGEWPALS